MTDITKTYAENACATLEDTTDCIITRLVTEKCKYESAFTDLFIYLSVVHPHILKEVLKNGLIGSMKENVENAMKMSKLTLE